MKASKVLFILVSFVIFSCGNPLFQNLAGVESSKLETPTISYDSDGYLRWNSISGATSYFLYRGSTSATSSMSLINTGINTSFYVSDYGKGKYYVVKAVDAYTDKESDYSNVVFVEESSSSLNTLDTPTITYNSDGYLKWDSISGAKSYFVYCGSTSSTSSMSLINTGINTSFYVSNFGKYYAVKAVDAYTNKKSDFSNVVFVEFLAAPTIKYDSDGYLRWNSITGATDYRVYYGSSSSPSDMSLLTTLTSASTQYNLESGYGGKYFCVRAYNSSTKNLSDYSNVVFVEESSSSSNKLETPTITYDSDGYLKWDSISGATSYFVYCGSTSSTSSMSLINTGINTSFYVSDFGKFYAVKAVDAYTDKESDYSNVVFVEETSSSSNKLETPTITYDSDGYLKWDSISDATSYFVYCGSTSSTSSMSLIKTGINTSFYVSDFGKYYAVKAVNAYKNKESDYSNVVFVEFLAAPTIKYDSDGYLRWDSITGATDYRVYYGSSSAPSAMSLLTTLTSTPTQYHLESGYGGKYFCVRAYNSSTKNLSDYSNVVQMPTIKWTATFVTNGGTAIASYETDIIKECPTTSREGYSLVGWYTDTDFKTSVTFPYALTNDTTFYAKWNYDFIFDLKIESYTNKSLSLSWKSNPDSTNRYRVTWIRVYIDNVKVDGFHRDSIYGGVWEWSKENLSFTTGTHSVYLSAATEWTGENKSSNTVQFTVN